MGAPLLFIGFLYCCLLLSKIQLTILTEQA